MARTIPLTTSRRMVRWLPRLLVTSSSPMPQVPFVEHGSGTAAALALYPPRTLPGVARDAVAAAGRERADAGATAEWIARLRRACLLLSLNTIGMLALTLLTARASTEQRDVALLALVWLAVRWIAEYRRPTRAPWWDIADGLALGLVGLAVTELPAIGSIVYLALLYASLSFRSLSLSGRRVVLGTLTYFVVYLAASTPDAWGANAAVTGIGYGHLPALSLLAAAAYLLATALTRRDTEATRFDALAAASTRLATAPDRQAVRGAVEAAVRRLVPGDDGLTVELAERDPGSFDLSLPQRQRLAAGEIVTLDAAGGGVATCIPLREGTEHEGYLVVHGLRAPGGHTCDDLAALARHAALAVRRIAREADLRAREAAYRSLVEHSADAVMVIARDLTIAFVSPMAARLFRTTAADLLGARLLDLLHSDHRARAIGFLEALIDGETAGAPVDWSIRGGDGGWVTVETTGSNQLDHPAISGLLLTSRDISDRKELERQLVRQAYHDPLTGLANRVLFREQLKVELDRPLRRTVSHAVLFLDLDRFKFINDTLGHEAGDALLQTVATRLLQAVRAEDLVARLGGDEFAIVLHDIVDELPAIQVAERILAAMEEPVQLAGHPLFITTSIGIALGSSQRDCPEDLIRRADIAMYQAKRQGRACYAIYDRLLDQHAVERLYLETELRSAVKRQQIEVYYQPLVSLASGHVEEVEALVRWRHPQRGLLAPSEFIELAEETGLIVSIGQYVLEQSCQQVYAWQQALGSTTLRLSVNLSARQFQQPGLVADVARALDASGLEPADLTLEITESATMVDSELTGRMLAELKGLGVNIAIDDFGIGYSALNTLKRFPVDRLKIDRSFVGGLGVNKGDTAIVGAVIACAKALDLQVTAEGIESVQQARYLRALECHRAQGFLISAPLAGGDLMAFLAKAQLPPRVTAGAAPTYHAAAFLEHATRLRTG